MSKTKTRQSTTPSVAELTQIVRDLEDVYDEDAVFGFAKPNGEPYSFRNCLLIVSQCEHATQLDGFVGWRERGRTVRKGEHSIKILAPAGRRDEEAPSEVNPEGKSARQFFRVAHVFDISQTDELEG